MATSSTDVDTRYILEGPLDGIGWVPRHYRIVGKVLESGREDQPDNPTVAIPLQNVTDVSMLATGNGREFQVKTNGKNFLLRAENETTARQWNEAINNAAKELQEKTGFLGTTSKPKGVSTPGGTRVELLSQTFHHLDMDQAKRNYVEQQKLKSHLSHVLLACADSRPRDPLLWMSEYMKKLSIEEDEHVYDTDENIVRYQENWRWYIYAAERKIDLWKEMMPSLTAEPPIARDELQKFTCFLPTTILQQIDNNKIKVDVDVVTTGASKPLNPICDQTNAVVVFTDASGFTALTERLSKQPNGAEELGRFLNVFFGKLINIVMFFGGDIIKFSGDAVTIMWPAEKGQPQNDPHEAIYRACQCCLHVHKALSDYETPVEGVNFSFHIGVGFGMVTIMQVGGIFDRWEYCIAGTPLEQIAIAEPLAVSGETCLSPQASALLTEACSALSIHCGPLTKTSVEGYVMLSSLADVPDLTKKSKERGKEFVGEKFEPCMLKKYIPGAMYRALSSGAQIEEEMRRVTVVFLSIEGLDTSVEEGATMAQNLMICCQRSVYALEGSINKFLVDDKGILVLSVFGLPPLSHFGDDPLRATLAGMRMMDSLKEEEVSGKVGVATGVVWCGVIGNDDRKEYTVLGDVVNLSARLMGKAGTAPGNILVDKITYEVLISNDFEVEVMEPMTMKGKSSPVPVFCPTGKIFHKDSSKIYLQGKIQQSLQSFWTEGREVEKMRRCILNQLNEEGGGVIMITGPPGVGKSDLLHTIRLLQVTEKFSLLEGNNLDPTGTHSVPFLAWQRIFTALGESIRQDPQLVAELSGGSSSYSGGVTMKSLVSSMLSQEMESWVPLLSKVMTGLEFGDTLVKAMTDADLRHQKQNQLRSICMDVIEWYSSRRPTVVLLHLKGCSSFNAELDRRSYPFIRGIADLIFKQKRKFISRKHPTTSTVGTHMTDQSASPRNIHLNSTLIFVMVCRDNSREMQNPTFTWLKEVARESGSFIEMKRFSRKETGKYLGYRYGYTASKPISLPDKMISYVHEMTQGNAALIDKIAEQFIEEEIVDVKESGEITWKPAEEHELEERLNKLQVHAKYTAYFTPTS